MIEEKSFLKIINKKYTFAQCISRICEAPFLAIPAFFILNFFLETQNFWIVELICIIFGTIIPILTVVIWSNFKNIDKDYTIKEDRNYPLLIVTFVYFIGFLILWKISANALTTSLMFCYATNTLIVFFINLKWKISIHSMGIAGPTTALLFFNPYFFILGLLGPFVMWSRVFLKKHTIFQVLTGSFLGYILTTFQIYYLIKLLHSDIVINVFLILIIILGLILPPFVLSLTGMLNDKGVHDGYTRKLFHFSAFGSFFIFIMFFDQISVMALVFSGTISILIACGAGLDFLWLKGMRRRSDFPNETFYVVLPLLSSLLWICIGSLFFEKKIVLIGTACVAVCDAIAEPVGVKFGKHKYKVRSYKGDSSQKSVEGSLSIFFSALFIVFFFVCLIFYLRSIV